MAPLATSNTIPAWVAGASPRRAFAYGLAVALTVPGWILFATSIGFGALARDLGFPVEHVMFIAGIVYALPAQVVIVDHLGRGGAALAAAFAVTLTAVRLLPMTVTLMPYLRVPEKPRWLMVIAVHFCAITSWLEGIRRLPDIPEALRLPHFLGLGFGLSSQTLFGAATGFFLAGSLPPLIAAALLFMTPIYFLLSLAGNARSRMDQIAVVLGVALGPGLFVLVPGFDLLIAGVGGGTIAYLEGRGRR